VLGSDKVYHDTISLMLNSVPTRGTTSFRSDKVDVVTLGLILQLLLTQSLQYSTLYLEYLRNNVLRSDKVDVVTLGLFLQLLMTQSL
jgi:hypothetical protein